MPSHGGIGARLTVLSSVSALLKFYVDQIQVLQTFVFNQKMLKNMSVCCNILSSKQCNLVLVAFTEKGHHLSLSYKAEMQMIK